MNISKNRFFLPKISNRKTVNEILEYFTPQQNIVEKLTFTTLEIHILDWKVRFWLLWLLWPQCHMPMRYFLSKSGSAESYLMLSSSCGWAPVTLQPELTYNFFSELAG